MTMETLPVLVFLDFTYRGRLVAYFTKLIYHKVLINNKTEQDTKQEFAYMWQKLCLMGMNTA